MMACLGLVNFLRYTKSQAKSKGLMLMAMLMTMLLRLCPISAWDTSNAYQWSRVSRGGDVLCFLPGEPEFAVSVCDVVCCCKPELHFSVL